MKISRNPDRTTEVLDLIRKSFMEKPRIELHLSDCLYPRKAYWQRVKPLPPTDAEIQYWVAGKGHEDALHRIEGLEKVPEKEWNGLKYGVDFYYGHPSEMKTRRKYLAPEGEELEIYKEYLRQLKGYCAVESDCFGYLFVWSLLEKTDEYTTAPEFVLYDVIFTAQELQEEQHRLLQIKAMLISALDTKDVPSEENKSILGHLKALPQCPIWMCAKTQTKVIEGKEPYCFNCKKPFASDKNIDKHINSKSGKGHLTRRGSYTRTVKPICRWLGDCKPEF